LYPEFIEKFFSGDKTFSVKSFLSSSFDGLISPSFKFLKKLRNSKEALFLRISLTSKVYGSEYLSRTFLTRSRFF
jgi:hypothetical protein